MKFVALAIESVLAQGVDPLTYEILVVDDGSIDATKDVLKKYADKIRLIEQGHLGPIAALNRGIKEAVGQYIAILDSDDVFEPAMLSSVFAVLEENPGLDFVRCDYKEISVDGKESIVSVADIANGVSAGFFIKKEVLEKIGGYDPILIFPEYDVAIQLTQNYQGLHLPLPLFVYLRRSRSLTGSKELAAKGKQQLFEKYGKTFNIREY